ncbi:MAG: type IV pilus modification PilV family protein [Gaiellaceae bacterium]
MRDRLRSEGGFGLVELLLAMLILNIGLLAVVAAFSSGMISLNRASRITTASVIADQQMELFRSLTHSSIRLNTTSVDATDTKYRDDPVIGGNIANLVTGDCAGPPDECNPSRQVTGADRKAYRLDTYITSETPTGGRPLKKVTIVVRDWNNLAVTFVRQASTFDVSTG